MRTILTLAEIQAIETAALELGFSTEPGGANEGDETTEEHCRVLHKVAMYPVGEEVEVSEGRVAAIRAATQELALSTEPGGANEDSPEAEAKLALLEALLGRLEGPMAGETDVAFDFSPRARLSQLAEESV